MDDLTLEVRCLDDVVVDDADRPDPRGGEVGERDRPEAPGADDEDPGVGQASLPLEADLGEEDVPGVPRPLLRGEVAAGGHERSESHGASLVTVR